MNQTLIILFMGGIGPTEIILIILAVFVLFGASKIPTFAKSLGLGLKEFRKAREEILNDTLSESSSADDPEIFKPKNSHIKDHSENN